MSMEKHLKELKTRHHELHKMIEKAEASLTDDIKLHQLKKEKLALKDAIEKLEMQLNQEYA